MGCDLQGPLNLPPSYHILLPRKQWEVCGYQKHILTRDPWDQLRSHLVAPKTTLQLWLTLAALFWELTMETCPQRRIRQRHDAYLWGLLCTEHPGAFPQNTHPYSHPHGRDNPAVCHPKQLQPATVEIKGREANLVQLESVPSGQHRETKVSEKHDWLKLSAWLARWTTHKATQGIDQRRRRPPQEQPGGRRNLLLHSRFYFWGDKRSKDESRLHWCYHCLSTVMPHDVRKCLDHSLAYSLADSASMVVAGHTLNDSSWSYWEALNTVL